MILIGSTVSPPDLMGYGVSGDRYPFFFINKYLLVVKQG